MILSSHGIIASQIASFDADAVAFFTRVTTAGGTLSTTEKQAVNQLVLDLKANSLWTPMKAIYPMVGASAAACAQNLKSASFTGTFGGGVSYSSGGVAFNGSSGYMNTNLNASSNLSVTNAHFSIYANVKNGSGDQMNGVYPGIFIDQYGRTFYGIGNSNDIINSDYVKMSQVNALSSNLKFYKNGSNLATISSGGVLPNLNLFLGTNSTVGPYWWNGTLAFSSIGDGLTDTEATDFYTAVQAFQTTLSRQV
jgi:hypothetical protein